MSLTLIELANSRAVMRKLPDTLILQIIVSGFIHPSSSHGCCTGSGQNRIAFTPGHASTSVLTCCEGGKTSHNSQSATGSVTLAYSHRVSLEACLQQPPLLYPISPLSSTGNRHQIFIITARLEISGEYIFPRMRVDVLSERSSYQY
jgi:hypothetical protein